MKLRATITALSAAALAAIAVPVAVAAFGSSDGPLANVMSGGRPNFANTSSFTNAGQPADATVYVVNHSHDPVTLVSASLIPIPGHATGRLTYVKLPYKRGDGIAGRGWPIPGTPGRSFRGAHLQHGLYSLIFGFTGNRIGKNYMTAGLLIRYRYHGQLHSVRAWASAVDCVTRDWHKTGNQQACNRASDLAQRETEHMSGG
jgi:hypothetical protein